MENKKDSKSPFWSRVSSSRRLVPGSAPSGYYRATNILAADTYLENMQRGINYQGHGAGDNCHSLTVDHIWPAKSACGMSGQDEQGYKYHTSPENPIVRPLHFAVLVHNSIESHVTHPKANIFKDRLE